MAEAEFHDVLSVDRERLFKVVTCYENYPDFVDGVTGVDVQRQGEGRDSCHLSNQCDVEGLYLYLRS